MRFANWYDVNKNKWWLLPLLLPSALLPLAALCNANSYLGDIRIALYYLPHAVMMALMIIFDWAALPGIILAIVVYYLPARGIVDTATGVFHYLLPLTISWGGYKIFSQQRSRVTFGHLKYTLMRMFWLVFCNATLFFFFYQVAVFFGLYDIQSSLLGKNPLQITTLINYQAILVGSLTGVPLSYFIIRMIRHPAFLFSFFSRMRAQFHPATTRMEIALWVVIMLIFMALLLVPLNESSTIFNTNYTLTLILPVMLWGAMRFGYLFITNIWTIVLIILCHYFYLYIPQSQDYKLQIAITTSCFAVFSFSIVLMALVTTRQRQMYSRVRRLAYIDPIVHIPNLRALSKDISKYAWSAICFLRVPGLELLGRNYGIMLRIQYKQQLAAYLRARLRKDEFVYQMAGNELVMRLNGESHRQHIEDIDRYIREFRFYWDGMPLQPQVGISYCYVRHPVEFLHLLLGEMSTMADVSITTNRPESLLPNGARQIQNAVREKVDMLHHLQNALDHDYFLLAAQPVQGIRGDVYYEILLRMSDEHGTVYLPDRFLPVAQEFGLSSKIDLWVLESTLAFMQQHREELPGLRLAVNLTPSSVCNAHFADDVKALIHKYGVEPWQLVFEVTESNSLTNLAQANQTLSLLQDIGCRIAIDDFGTGYASYARLRDMNADIMKIDGSFIRNILTSSLDYQIVESICQLARVKKMQIVAEYVESDEIRAAVEHLGIDYLQGYAIGRPVPLSTLLEVKEPAAGGA
ncbi:EAL domain-containing protein [Entomohabitans teleogrylli]|uniref:sensor domain-containing phosphodiesterase n=1 Tax=Entomohabitans teleogrylli TaxID=1384589 RepID=UPI00073DAB69|nr:EAL domain-containing protein [Entomohabitans teleogrylli]